MKQLYRYTTVALIAAVSLAFSAGCKHNNPSVVGNWTLYSVQDSSISSGQTMVYTYSSANSTLYEYQSPPTPGDSTTTAYLLQLNIQSNGAYVISEALPLTAQTDTFTNSWSVSTNNVLTLNGIVNTTGQDPLVFSFANNSNDFVITQLDAHTLQISQNWAYSVAGNSAQRNVSVMTFKR